MDAQIDWWDRWIRSHKPKQANIRTYIQLRGMMRASLLPSHPTLFSRRLTTRRRPQPQWRETQHRTWSRLVLLWMKLMPRCMLCGMKRHVCYGVRSRSSHWHHRAQLPPCDTIFFFLFFLSLVVNMSLCVSRFNTENARGSNSDTMAPQAHSH